MGYCMENTLHGASPTASVTAVVTASLLKGVTSTTRAGRVLQVRVSLLLSQGIDRCLQSVTNVPWVEGLLLEITTLRGQHLCPLLSQGQSPPQRHPRATISGDRGVLTGSLSTVAAPLTWE